MPFLIGDHLLFWIISGPMWGPFAALYSFFMNLLLFDLTLFPMGTGVM